MPTHMEFNSNGATAPVATEEELLDFCNRVREAGGANVLEALLPSTPGNSHQCLIANALNFGCQVSIKDPENPLDSRRKPNGTFDWMMILPENLSEDQEAKIAEAIGSEVQTRVVAPGYGLPCKYVDLPAHIGNAAHAFDLERAFLDYVTWE